MTAPKELDTLTNSTKSPESKIESILENLMKAIDSILAMERERQENLEGEALVDSLVREEALLRAKSVIQTGDFDCHINAVGKV